MRKFEKLFLTLFLFTLSFVPFLWLSKGQLILGYDAVFPLNPTAFLLDRIYSWTSVQGFTMDQSGIQGSLIIHFIDSIPYFFGFSAEYAQKIVFSFWFFAILFSSFIFIVRLEKSGFIQSKYLRYFFPILYTFNFYLLQGWWAIERTKFSLVVATPLILSIILPMLKQKLSVWKVFKSAVLCSLILSIFNGGGWVGLPLYGGLFVILGCYYLFFGFIFLINKKIREFLFLNLFFVFLFVWHVALNAYTLLPFLLTTVRSYGDIIASSGGMAGLIEWTKYISNDASFLNLFRLQGIPDWYNNGRFHPYASAYLNNSIFILSSFLLPIAVFLSFVRKHREDKLIIPFFLLILIVSMFFTAGAHPPLGFIFEFLMKTVPGFVAFRSAIFKFGYAYWLAVSFFAALSLGALLAFLIGKIKNTTLSAFSSIIVPAIAICLILLYHFPFLTGNIFRIDPTRISARVDMPSYISDFTKWWEKNGQGDKILLLPKLNNDWLFEQYKWNYMSLFPITGNFASRGIVENAVILTSNENIAVNELYDAINNKDYEKVDFLSANLGTRYFLVRRDFYYDYPNQTTIDPRVVEKNLIQNPKIQHIITFGQWVVYKYSEERPTIFTKSSAVLLSGKVDFDKLYALIGDNVFIEDQGVPEDYRKTFSDVLLNPTCLTCSAEKEERQVYFPKPKILVDSKLYEIVELRDKLRVKKNEPLGTRIDRLTGNTIKLTGQIEQLLEKDKEAYYIDIAKRKYTQVLKEISDLLPEIFSKMDNPYYYAVSIKQYLDQEEKLLNTFISSRIDEKSILRVLGEALYAIEDLKDKIAAYYDNDKGYNRERIYNFSINNPGAYDIKLDKESIGNLDGNDLENSLLLSLDKQATRGAQIQEPFINFGNVYLEKGDHAINIFLPQQKSVASTPEFERIVGKNCYSSFVDNYSSKKDYVLRFNVKNDFDPSFFYFIDNGASFVPGLLNRILIAGAQIESVKIVISPKTVNLDGRSTKLRVSFCGSSLTEDLFKANVRDLSIVELISPLLFLHQNTNQSFPPAPEVSFREVNQTHSKAYVKNAQGPYYLIYNQRNDFGWKANIGESVIGNNFQNTWYVNKIGDYEIDIFYRPQKYFDIGAIISVIFLAITGFIIIRRNRDV